MTETIRTGDEMFYRYQVVKVVRPAFPRFGDARVVVERESDKRRFTVATKYLRPRTGLESAAALRSQASKKEV